MNQRDGLSNENRRAFWQQAVALLQESGLTTSAFARREKLSPQTLNKVADPGQGDLGCARFYREDRQAAIHQCFLSFFLCLSAVPATRC